MRGKLRWSVLSAAGALVAAIAAGVIGEWFIEFAREKEFYRNPSGRMDAIMSAASAFVTQTWFFLLTAVVVGSAIGLWADSVLRWSARRAEERDHSSNYELGNLCIGICNEIHEYIEFASGMALLYKEETHNLREETWSADIRAMHETAQKDMVTFRKKFGSRLFYIEDELMTRGFRRLALDGRPLSSAEERGQLADEIGALGLRLRAGRKPPRP